MEPQEISSLLLVLRVYKVCGNWDQTILKRPPANTNPLTVVLIPPVPAILRLLQVERVRRAVGGSKYEQHVSMLARLLTRSLHFRSLALTLASASSHHPLTPLPLPPPPTFLSPLSRSLSTHQGRGGDNESGSWKFTPGADDAVSPFGEEEDTLSGITETPAAGPELIGGGGSSEDLWTQPEEKDVFEDVDKSFGSAKGGGVDEWETAEGYKPWSLGDEKVDVFDGVDGEGIEGLGGGEIDEAAAAKADEEKKQLEWREKELRAKVKGPERAFGDLIEMSGITDDMICSLILHKDVRNIPGLRPLHEIEDRAIQKQSETSTRGEIERKKQEEIAQARVRQVDEKGRAYGTGRRKCSIARVWIQCGDGKFMVNDKPFDSYFPILDHRAQLLHPFILTNTLGLWDITCTVKGGGVSGQVGAIRLGISRALQNWEPGLRQYLKPAGYMTRDPRVVERKKPGKAKARKSFQWVKR